MKAGRQLGTEIKGGRKKEVWLCISFVQGQHKMFLSFTSTRDSQSKGEKGVEESGMSGDCYKAEDSIMVSYRLLSRQWV